VLVTLAAAAAMLAGCASIPQSGAVHPGDVQDRDGGLTIDILAQGPAKGASQEEILRGFVDAAASPQGGYEVAKQFLTSRFATEWNPDAGTLVDGGAEREYSQTGDLSMTLSMTPIAEISAHGQYAESAVPTSTILQYEFAKVGGEWRVSKAPQGILIDKPTFDVVFGAYSLYFYDPTFTYLVPDLRWFARRPTTPTQVVRELLAGPSPWLTGAVVSAFPVGTTLAADAVIVTSRDAKVPLSSDAVRGDQVTQQRMREQLGESLFTVPSIGSVTIVVGGIEQEIPDFAVQPQPKGDSRALVLRDGAFGFLASTGDSVQAIEGISDPVAALDPLEATLGRDQTTAAVLNASGVWSVRAGSDAVHLDSRRRLIAPGIDAAGFVWSVPGDAPSAITAFDSSGGSHPVATNWPDAQSIAALRISRDGTRVIALLQADGGARFVAAAVIRDADTQVPTSLGDPLELTTAVGTPLDATWTDDVSVVSLTDVGDGATRLITQQIGGSSVAIDGTDASVTVAGGNSVRDLRLLTADGVLEQRRGVVWQPRIDGVSLLATQQGR
jgi:hypothetical protein